MSFRGSIGDIVETRGINGEFSIEWRIHDFFVLSSRSGDHYTSPFFSLFDAKWYLRLFPNGLTQVDPPSEWVNLIFYRQDFGLPKTLNVKIRIPGAQEVENIKEITQEFSEKDRGFSWFRFYTRSYLWNQRSKLMPDNLLIIRCDMKCKVPSSNSKVQQILTLQKRYLRAAVRGETEPELPHETSFRRPQMRGRYQQHQQLLRFSSIGNLMQEGPRPDLGSAVCSHLNNLQGASDYIEAFTQTDEDCKKAEVSTDGIECSEKRGVEELQKSLHGLLASKKECDVIIKVKDKEFPVHRIILQARSQIFEAMFTHDMVEKQSGVVNMEDCNPETFLDFLEHIYTGSVKMISLNNVFSLYTAADKYDLSALKQECSNFIKGNMTVASFCEAITLAVKHDDKPLIECATGFFCNNSINIVKTSEWQIFLEENSTVGNELFIKLLSKHEDIFCVK